MKQKILIVDDERSVLELLSYTLERQGYDPPDLAEDAVSAIELLDNNLYAVVITDKNMPGTDHALEGGLDVLATAKRKNPDCAVIILTGYATLESSVQALRLGAADYVSKPPNIKQFTEKIKRLLRYQAALDPQETLSTFSMFQQELLNIFETIEEKCCNIDIGLKEKLLKDFQGTVDGYLQKRSQRDALITDLRDALCEVASLAGQLQEQLPEDDGKRVLVEKIINEASNCP